MTLHVFYEKMGKWLEVQDINYKRDPNYTLASPIISYLNEEGEIALLDIQKEYKLQLM